MLNSPFYPSFPTALLSLSHSHALPLALHPPARSVSKAVYHDRLKLVSLLVGSDADPAVLDFEGRSFAHLASNGKSPKIMHLLAKMVDFDQFVNLPDNRAMSPLHWSCFHGSVAHTKELLSAGADVMAVDAEGKSALHWAATTKSEPLFQMLVAAFNSDKERAREAREDSGKHIVNLQDLQGRTPLQVAVGIGNTVMVTAMLSLPDTSVKVQDVHGRTALHWSVQLGHAAMMTTLLDKAGIEQFNILDANGWTALHYAAHDTDPNECATILAKHPKVVDRPDNHGQTALVLAILAKNVRLAKVLIEQGSDPLVVDETGSTPLHVASFVGDVSIIKKLLSGTTAGIDQEDSSGQTPLFFACEQGWTDAVKYLISRGADPKHIEGEGRTTLHFATLGGHSVLCEYLMRACNVDPNTADQGGRTSLHTATYAGDTSTTEVLIANNADVNAQDSAGISPMHWAAASNSIECVAALIAAEAFLNHTEYHSERLTPLDYATMTEGDNAEMVEFIQVNGGLSVQEIKDLAAKHIQAWWAGYRTRIRLMATWHQYLSKHASGDAKAALLARRKKKVVGHDQQSSRAAMAAKARQRRGSQWNEGVDPDAGLISDRGGMLGGMPEMAERKPVHGSKLKALDGGQGAGSYSKAHNRTGGGQPSRSMNGRGGKKKPPHHMAPIDAEPTHTSDGVSTMQASRITKVKRERNRVGLVRRKMAAARVIQQWYRAHRLDRPPGWTIEAARARYKNRGKRKAVRRGGGGGRGGGSSRPMDMSLDNSSRSPLRGEIEKRKESTNPYHKRKEAAKETEKKVQGQNTVAFGVTSALGYSHVNPNDDRQQVAALTIQLFWRQHLRRRNRDQTPGQAGGVDTKMTKQLTRRQQYGRTVRNTVVIPAAKVYQEKGFTSRKTLYRPQLKRLERPNPLLNVPLVAVTAFNLAFATYWPPEIAERIERKTRGLTTVSDAADEVLSSFVSNMANIRELRQFQSPPRVQRTGAVQSHFSRNPQFALTHPNPEPASFAMQLTQEEEVFA